MSSYHCVSLMSLMSLMSLTSMTSHLCSCGLTMSLSPTSKSLYCGYGLPSLSLTMSKSLLYGYDPQSLRLLGLTMSCERLSCPLCLGLQKYRVKEYLSLRCCLHYLCPKWRCPCPPSCSVPLLHLTDREMIVRRLSLCLASGME